MARILVIDDNPEFRVILQTHLGSAGHETLTAADGDAGIALLEDQHASIDVVVTDILMPQRDGVEVLRAVKRRWPHLPVIALSGGGWIGAEELLGMAERLGADQVLQKPVTRETLLRVVEDALRKPQGQRG